MRKKNLAKVFFHVALCSVLALVCSAAAMADVEIFSNDKIALKMYGQINRAVMYADDGDTGEWYHVDNDHSSTRLGLKVNPKMSDKFTVGANLEFEYQSNASNKVWQELSNTSGDKWDERKVEAWIKSSLGKLTLGQGPTASDGTSEVDLSGTKVCAFSLILAAGGSVQFFGDNNTSDSDNTNALSGVRVSDVFNNLDGLSRKDRIRYDTPTFNGFSLAASTVSDEGDDAEDVALRYKGKLGDIKTAGALSYVHYSSSDSKKSQVSGSLSFLMENGLSLTVAAGDLDYESSGRDDGTFVYGKVGYIAKLCPLGTTAFSIDLGKFEDMKAEEDEADAIGFQCVQKLKDWHTEIYLNVRHYELDRVAADYDDILVGLAGLRVKF